MYEIRLVRERRTGYGPSSALRTPSDVYRAFKDRFEAKDREEFLVVLLDGRNRAMGFNVVAVGTLTAALVHPREVFKPAIVGSAAALLLVHNHPSGDPEPSAEDMALTRRLKQAGDLLGIALLDHVVIGASEFVSLQERGII